MKLNKNFLSYEFIGLHVEVHKSSIKSLEGLYGEIIDETKNVFYIKTENGVKIVPKANSKFIFYYDDFVILVDGNLIRHRPWDRLKIKLRKII
ncbi:MAG: ribonuclease P protein component 1 [Nanopusillaceae archaeon]